MATVWFCCALQLNTDPLALWDGLHPVCYICVFQLLLLVFFNQRMITLNFCLLTPPLLRGCCPWLCLGPISCPSPRASTSWKDTQGSSLDNKCCCQTWCLGNAVLGYGIHCPNTLSSANLVHVWRIYQSQRIRIIILCLSFCLKEKRKLKKNLVYNKQKALRYWPENKKANAY